MDGSTLGAAIALMKKNKPTDEQIENAVSDWLDDHPEATTTVQDGSITKAKLDSNLQGTVDDVSDLKNEIDDLGVVSTNAIAEQQGIINSTGKWANINSSNTFKVLPVKSGDVVKVTANGSKNLYIAFFKSYPNPVNAASCDLSEATGFTGRITVLYNSYGEYTTPSDAKYLWYQTASGGNDVAPSSVTIDGYEFTENLFTHLNRIRKTVGTHGTEITELTGDVEDIGDKVESKLDAFVSEDTPFGNSGYIGTNGAYSGGASWSCTEYIPIISYVTSIAYKLAGVNTALSVAFYDAGKTYITGSGVPGDSGTAAVKEGTVSVPNNAKYFRACDYTSLGENKYARQILPADTFIEIDQKSSSNQQGITSNREKIETLELMESIVKPFVFSGKQITAFGDSITSGVTSPNLVPGTPYIKYFADAVGATLVNRAVSGQRFADNSANSIYTKITTYSDATDIIWIAGGTNDYQLNSELGTFSSESGTTTFYGALKAICAYLTANYPDTPVIFLTPIPYTDINEDAPNTAGYTLNDYRRAIYEIATANGHSVISGTGIGMPTNPGGWGNAMIDDTDGCHPTEAGHKLMARSIAGKLL